MSSNLVMDIGADHVIQSKAISLIDNAHPAWKFQCWQQVYDANGPSPFRYRVKNYGSGKTKCLAVDPPYSGPNTPNYVRLVDCKDGDFLQLWAILDFEKNAWI